MNAYKLKYDLIPFHDDAELVRIVIRSKPGSACRREWTVGHARRGSPRLTAFRERVDAMRSARQMTVEDRSKLLAVVWSDLQPLSVN